MKNNLKPNLLNTCVSVLMLISFISLPNRHLKAQCPPGNVTLTTQAQVNAFVAAYPNCTTISGNLIIGTNGSSWSYIYDISGLSALTTVNGNLIIQFNYYLSSLAGLNNINSVTGEVDILLNPSLTNLNGLNSLTTIGGRFSVRQNYAFVNFQGINSLTSIGGDFRILSNSSHTNFSGLNNLNYIGGTCIWSGNNQLSDISSLLNLASIGGGFYLLGGKLTTLNGLNNLTQLGGDLYINGCANLINLNALENLISINGRIEMSTNSSLTSLHGLENIDPSTIKDLRLMGCPNLSVCHVESICGYLADPSATTIIQGNSTGCKTRLEVETLCPACPDDDQDGICNDNDNCIITPNAGQEDADGDGTGDACDGCPNDPNKTEPGICGCGIPDTDTDGDGFADCIDNCDNAPNPGQEDNDCDGVGDVCDLCPGGNDGIDNNNDGIADCSQLLDYNSYSALWYCGNNKISICHNSNNNPETICINKNALEAHFNHGDFVGPCTSCANQYQIIGGNGTTIGHPAGLATEFAVFPNPAGMDITVAMTPSPQTTRLTIENTLGVRVIMEKILPGTERYTIDISTLPPGIYFIRTEDRLPVQFVKQ